MTAYLTTDEVADLIKMSADYVARQCKLGNLRAQKLGTEWRITPGAVEEFMAGEKPAPTRSRLSARQMRRSA